MAEHKMHSGFPEKSRSTFTLDAVPTNFSIAQERVQKYLDASPCSMKTQFELDMIIEEVFINIANYAYGESTGTVSIDLALNEARDLLAITFRDSGIPYDPLKKAAPDLSSAAKERAIGGLGIFLIRKLSDDISYQYDGHENRLTILKKLD